MRDEIEDFVFDVLHVRLLGPVCSQLGLRVP